MVKPPGRTVLVGTWHRPLRSVAQRFFLMEGKCWGGTECGEICGGNEANEDMKKWVHID